jgi:hypothetical protein
VEVGRAHSFAHRCRAADIGEQQSDRDLYPSHLTFAKHGYASRAESWIAWGLPVPGVPENEATQPGERSRAQLAAGRGRDSSKRPPLAREAGTLPLQHGADPFRGQSLRRHLLNLHTPSVRMPPLMPTAAFKQLRGASTGPIPGTGQMCLQAPAHADMVEDPLVILFPDNGGAACKLGHLGPDQSPSAGHVPRTFTSHADVDMEPVLR